MTTLSFASDQVLITHTTTSELLTAFSTQALETHGYSNIEVQDYIFASKNDCLIDLFLLYTNGQETWRLVVCAGPNQPACDAVRDGVRQLFDAYLPAVRKRAG